MSSEVKKQTKFQSPLPFIIQLRNFIFGSQKPRWYVQWTFFIDIIAVFLFALWSAISFFTIAYRQVFFDQKGVDVASIIELRGIELGFEPGQFIERLHTFHGISMICWLVALFGLILLWRNSKYFAWFFFGATCFYFGMLLFYVGFDYYMEDTTRFDKILFLLMIVQTLIYLLLSNRIEEEQEPTFFE